MDVSASNDLPFSITATYNTRYLTPEGVSVQLMQYAADKVNIFEIETPEGLRGQGHGTRALAELCQGADKDGVTLSVMPAPPDPMMYHRVRNWYARHGFVDDETTMLGFRGMHRTPQGEV